MIFPIQPQMTLGELQRRFQRMFPFLKLEFFNEPFAWETGSEGGINYHPSFRLGKVAGKPIIKNLLKVRNWDTPGKLEEKFIDDLGLHAQVYRRFEDHWIQTDGSDDVSLAEQNELGRKSAERFYNMDNIWVEREKIL